MSNQTPGPDPFEQANAASEAGTEPVPRVEAEPLQIEPIDDDVDAELDIDAPDHRRASADADSPRPRGRALPVVGLVATAALILSLSSAVGVGVVLTQTSQLRADVGVALTDVDDNIATLGNRLSESELSISQVRDAADTNRAQIRRLDTDQLAVELAKLRGDLSEVDTAFSRSKVDAQATLQSLEQRVRDLEAQADTLQRAAKQTADTPSARQSVRRAPKPSVLETLEGNPIVSVDQWGYTSNVILLDQSTGQLVSVTQGASINGWRYVAADPKTQTASFAKGSLVVRVRIQG